jgi:hypothetical protein
MLHSALPSTRDRRSHPTGLALGPCLPASLAKSKPAPPDEIIHLLDQLYVLGVAGGLILQMVAVLQANQRAEPPVTENESGRSLYNSVVRQRLGDALRNCEGAIDALMKLTRARTA